MWYLEDEDVNNTVTEDDDVENNGVVEQENDEETGEEGTEGESKTGVNIPKNAKQGATEEGASTNSSSEHSTQPNTPTDQSQSVINDLNDKKGKADKPDTEKKSDTPTEKKGDSNSEKLDVPKGNEGNIPKDKPNYLAKAAQGFQENGLKGATSEVSKEFTKQQVKKQLAKRGVDVFLKSVGATVGPILAWVALILLIIIIVVGILMFFVAMPGQIVTKIKGLASNVMKAWSAMIEGEDVQVSTVQIANVANYIESMGYDLKGEGFVTYDKKEEDIETTIDDIQKVFKDDSFGDLEGYNEEQLEELLYLDSTQGVIRRNDTGDIVDINSESILSYIISDNQCYIIRNFNTSLDEMTGGKGGLIAGIIAAAAAVIGVVVAIFLWPVGLTVALVGGLATAAGVAGGSYLATKMINNPDWGKGLITIWHEGDAVGKAKPDGYYKVSEKGEIALDANTKTLYIKKGWSNGTYSFDVDGWSGRYGMPLEFLLSVHLATQMPELAVEMATSFETDVEVLLHNVKGKVIAGVLKQNPDNGSWHSGTDDDDFITYDDVSEIGKEERNLLDAAWEGLKDFGNWVAGVFTGEKPWTDEELEELAFNTRSICELFEEGMPHSINCECCSHIPGGQGFEAEECFSDDDIFDEKGNTANGHVLCTACQERVWAFIGALKVTNDRKAESYTPYISKVTDHWFRDVYFVMNKDEGEYQSVVQVDEDYFYETGERWTMYETWEEGDTIPEGFQVGDYKLYEYNEEKNEYKLSDLSKAKVQEINEKIALGDTSVTRLVKKAVTQNLASNWGDDWSAYILTGSGEDEATWEKIGVGQDTKNELKNDYVYKNENSSIPEEILIYYKDIRPDDIKQVEDGQRTETNSKIKDMFLNKAYYKYDGSVTRADAIIADKSRADNKTEYYNTKSGDTVKDIEGNSVTSPGDQRNKELIAKVDINKDSLGAFSILENTHTLDADYIYRDFKELIVELNYFDKEDLSDKIETVMQWVIPECGSAGWPIRRYEKGENFYGTLINSKIDLMYMKKKDIEDAEITLEQLQDEVESETTSGGSTTGTVKGSVAEFVNLGYEVHKVMEGNNWDYCILSDQGSGPHMADTCGNDDCKKQHCDTYNAVSSHVCGLNTSIKEAQDEHHNTCCATYVSWVLNEMGFGFASHGARATYDWCKENNWTEITDYHSLKPGDFLFNGSDGNIGHVQMLGNNGEWLNAGGKYSINNPPEAKDANFIIGMRSTLNGAAAEFEGYDPEQAVVAPVTGKVVDYGTVKRENIETGKEEEVGYIKIQALDHYITIRKGGYVKDTVLGCTDVDDEYDPENTYDPNKQEGYDYFYEEYKGVIDGCVLYIEGFDLTIDETLANADFSSEDVTRYEPNEVYNMTDNLKEAQALWREDAKNAAAPYFKDGEDIYIKEGTVIGKTYEDTEFEEDAKGNGNYIRLILRDLEDSIMEDVETYFDIPESYSFNGSVGNIQNIESADPTLMSLIEQLAGPMEGQYPGIVNMLKAISMNESGGGTNPAAGDDPMQAVESTGGNAGDSIGGWENSVKAAINALTDAWDKARDYGINDLRVVIQAYNYGSGFVDYTHNKGVNAYSKSLAEQFSDEQAAKLGWSGYGDKNYVDPKIYNYLPDLNV